MLCVGHRSAGDGGLTPGLPLWWPALIDVMNVIRCYRRDRSAWPLSLSPPSFLGPTEWSNNASEWRAEGGVGGGRMSLRKENRQDHSFPSVSLWRQHEQTVHLCFKVGIYLLFLQQLIHSFILSIRQRPASHRGAMLPPCGGEAEEQLRFKQ